MKALPPHKGHLYLIDTALEKSEKVTLLVCSLKNEPIPGDYRFSWLKEIYKREDRLTIINFKEEVPQYPEEHPNFWDIWVDIAKKNCPDSDVIFTSETYGDPYAEKIGIKHYLVDLERKKYPISGTKIRNNPFESWDFIPKEIRSFFVKRIVLMGPESVGKSTMTKRLANRYQTNFVDEYGRIIYENNGNKIFLRDFVPISEGRQSLEDWMIKESNKLLFCDTEDITTYLFSKLFFPNDYKSIESFFLEKIKTKPKYDLYILLKPDCKAVQDGTRSFLKERQDHYNQIKEELVKNNCNYFEVGGEWEERFESCLKILKSNFNI